MKKLLLFKAYIFVNITIQVIIILLYWIWQIVPVSDTNNLTILSAEIFILILN